MAEVLWYQKSGVDYSADEDRRALGAMFNAGVISGLTLTAGSGLSGSVSAGKVMIPDGVGGNYLAYFDNVSTVTGLTANSTNNVYATFSLTDGQASIVKGAAPTTPYQFLGNFVTNASAITATNNTATQAEDPTVAGRYLRVSGGTMTGTTGLNAPRLVVSGGLDVSVNTSINAPLGVRLGGAVSPTARASARGALTVRQLIAASTWTKILFDSVAHSANDYGALPLMDVSTTTTQGRFLIPVSGDYLFSGAAHFVNQVGATNTRRLSRIMCYNADGSVRWWRWCTQRAAGGNEDSVTFDAMMDCSPGQWVEFQVYHDENHSVYLSSNDNSSGTLAGGDRTHGAMRLIQAD